VHTELPRGPLSYAGASLPARRTKEQGMEEFVARCVMGMHTRDDGGASPQPHSAFLRKQSYLSSVCITRCAAEGQHCARQVLGYLPRCGCAVPRGTKSIAKLSALNWGPRRVARAVQRGVRNAHDHLLHLHACRTARPPPLPSFARQQLTRPSPPLLPFPVPSTTAKSTPTGQCGAPPNLWHMDARSLPSRRAHASR